ncbi:MAG: threonine--tRNA ligase [bacterium]
MDDKIHAMRHSAAHVLAAAIQQLYPEAQFGVGPVIENGFYYDVKLAETLSDKDLKRVESVMRGKIKANIPMEREDLPIEQAISYFEEHNQPYKVELLKDLQQHGTTKLKDFKAEDLGAEQADDKITTISVYKTGDFVDLCKGPHVAHTGEIGVIKLTKLAGAYWRGDEKRDQLQRIYGLAFETQEDLDLHLERVQLALERDHRKLGQELDLFVFSSLVGSGLPLFTPRGTVLREELNRYSQELRQAHGFEKVWIPHITKTDLYKASGHWDKFGDELLLVTSQETHDEFVLKPMNCPHHQQIFAGRPRSYRDLPIKYLETTTVYRDEKSGELNGLSRVRSITQDDSHIFCRPDQIKQELLVLTKITQKFYAAMGMKLRARISLRDDSPGYLGDPGVWEYAEKVLKEVAEEAQLEWYEGPGEAAFYGPKIDFMATDALGREHQLATPQLDFVQPDRFGLSYTDSDGSDKTPVMIHFALLGSIERFLSVYIEHTGGIFPVWLAPEQVRVLPISEKVADYADEVLAKLVESGIRAKQDASAESLGKRIRAAELMKVPYTLVVGEREAADQAVAVRRFGEGDIGVQSLDEFVAKITTETQQRSA